MSPHGSETGPERMRPLYRPRRRAEDNINMSDREIWIDEWIGCIWIGTSFNGGIS